MLESDKIITIDGPAGSGKGTVARMVALEKGYSYLDTGAMYRTIALTVREKKINLENESEINRVLNETKIKTEYNENTGLNIYLNNTDVSEKIRTPEISKLASDIARIKIVREFLVKLQREIGLKGKIVVEGRDMGTYVFPGAKNKFYLDATAEERANRRYRQLKEKSKREVQTYEEVLNEIKTRDKQDMERKESPLHPALNAVIIDTTSLTPSEVVVKILESTEAA